MKKKFILLSSVTLLLCSIQQLKAQNDKIAGAGSWKLSGNSGTDPLVNFVGTKDGSPLVFRTNNVERMRILKAGKVGIGTSTPTAKLNVIGDTYVTLAQSGYLTLGNDSTSNMTLDYNIVQARYNGGASSLFLNYYGGNVYVGPGSIVSVSSTGANLGGTTTLAGNTTINGNFNFGNSTSSIQFANPSTSPAPMMYMFQSGIANTPRMVIAHSPAYPTWGLQYVDSTDKFDFLAGGASRMSINLGNGNVGIGVTSPTYRLEVCGTIRAKEVLVETGWCDYVFAKDYKLRTLGELEQYINDNQHLPGIAPASEVEKDGLKVAEMNKAMMEKIEELTLYVIQLGKENKKLQAEIDAIKK